MAIIRQPAAGPDPGLLGGDRDVGRGRVACMAGPGVELLAVGRAADVLDGEVVDDTAQLGDDEQRQASERDAV